MRDDERTARLRDELDSAVRALAEPLVNDAEIIVGWVVVAATRSADSGGATIALVSDDGMPHWQAKGMLQDQLDTIRRLGDEDAPEQD